MKLARKKSKNNTTKTVSKNNSPSTKSLENKKPRSKFTKYLLKTFKPFIWVAKKVVPKYFVYSFRELKNVTWPNRREARRLTTAVILFSFVLSVSVALVDYGLDKLFKKVILKQ